MSIIRSYSSIPFPKKDEVRRNLAPFPTQLHFLQKEKSDLGLWAEVGVTNHYLKKKKQLGKLHNSTVIQV